MTGSRSPRIVAQRGISQIVVVALVLVTIVLAFTAIVMYANDLEKERTAKALEERIKKLNIEQSRLKKIKDASLAPTGFTLSAPTPVDGEVAAPVADALPTDSAREELKTRRGKLLEKPAQMDDTQDPSLSTTLQEHDRRYADLAKNATGERAFNTLQELVSLAATRVILAFSLTEQRRAEVAQAEERKAAIVENMPKLPTRAKDYNSELETKISEVTKSKGEIDTKASEASTSLQGQIDAAKKKIETLKIDYNKENIRFSNQVNKLRSELDELKVKEVIRLQVSEAHGRLINPDIPNKVGFIDLGSRERIVPGLKFLVAKKGPQGKFQYKGKILVKKVWMTYSEVAITDIYDRNVPVIDGDLIVNPLFNPRRPVVVAFVGEGDSGRLRPNWSTNEANRRIVEIGSEVRERITLDVDFVIFTWVKNEALKDTDERYKLSVLLGIPIEEASDLYRFLED